MTTFIPVRYLNRQYPFGIQCPIEEIAGHFDRTYIHPTGPYSLHTEYSFKPRTMDSPLIQRYPALAAAHRRKVPQLWVSEDWADQFADFVRDLVGENPSPAILEIHPPFLDVCPDIPTFFARCRRFEARFRVAFPHTKIALENRSGSSYKGSGFLISSADSIVRTLASIQETGLDLHLVLDYPQLFTAEEYPMGRFPMARFKAVQDRLAPYRDRIAGIHVWGRRGVASHCGTLTDLFEGDKVSKDEFVRSVLTFFDDGQARYFVPEVNSTVMDLVDVVDEFIQGGVEWEEVLKKG